ncbi:phenylacetate--CoA ligase family protein [Ramlibacter sp.]|uniref:phenylacetate--CoA ligase family protein n=1 Tax=Ramlibacter sp. TaxID=1917967 RepID=UPI003D0F1286
MTRSTTPDSNAATASRLPLYRNAFDFDALIREFPLPDVFEETTWRAPPERIRAIQEERFLRIVEVGWNNPFYRKRWTAAGLQPGDIRSLDDIVKLPTYTSDDVKDSLEARPPFGDFHGFDLDALPQAGPLKMQTSGGTTGIPRPTLFDAWAWEAQAILAARALYIQGARPGDVMQIPMTCSLANAGWLSYKACHDFLGVLPLTTGSGVVTSSRQQLEIGRRFGTTMWHCFPEYLLRLAQVAQEELGLDVRDLKTKFLRTYFGPDTEGTLRRDLEDRWGCVAYDAYGANEISAAAFECREQNGLHLMEDAVYIEVLDVETGQPVAPGERGNLVATVFFRTLPPIIRYNLRDLGRILSHEKCGCGSHFRRMDHFLGRSDAMVKLRGVNVYPMACLPAVRSDPRTTGEWFCIVERVEGDKGAPRDEMEVRVEVRRDAGSRQGLQDALEKRLKDELGVAVRVALVEEGDLAELANTQGREGKPRRLVDRRPAYQGNTTT